LLKSVSELRKSTELDPPLGSDIPIVEPPLENWTGHYPARRRSIFPQMSLSGARLIRLVLLFYIRSLTASNY
jgi:hypothetical protein